MILARAPGTPFRRPCNRKNGGITKDIDRLDESEQFGIRVMGVKRLACGNCTPFRCPVVPDVNMMSDSESGVTA